MKSAGLGVGLLALSACNPYPELPAYTVTIDNPTEGSNPGLKIDVNATVGGGFNLVESDCDPTNFDADPGTGAVIPLWSPYDCSDEEGNVPEDQGNIQFFVDGLFYTYATSATFTVDLTPAIKIAYYEPMDIDPATPNPDGSDAHEDIQNVFVCNFLYPDDNLHYASTTFLAAGAATAEQLGNTAVYEAIDDGAGNISYDVMDPQPYSYEIFDLGYYPQWALFDYSGATNTQDDGTTEHIFYAELHYVNHSVVYGVPRERIITKDFSDAAQETLYNDYQWCGFNYLL
jgi:hypothetical protein